MLRSVGTFRNTTRMGSVLGSIWRGFEKSWRLLGSGASCGLGHLLGLAVFGLPLGSSGRLLNDFWSSGKVSGGIWGVFGVILEILWESM